MEADASLASLVSRLTQEDYDAYLRRLTEEEGVDPKDDLAARRFDKHRKGRKTSNEEWKNLYQSAAKRACSTRMSTSLPWKRGRF